VSTGLSQTLAAATVSLTNTKASPHRENGDLDVRNSQYNKVEAY